MLPALKLNTIVVFAVGALPCLRRRKPKIITVSDAFSTSRVPFSFSDDLPGWPLGPVSYFQSKDWALGAMIEWRLAASRNARLEKPSRPSGISLIDGVLKWTI